MEHLAWSPASRESRVTVLNINKELYLEMCPTWSKTSENTGTGQCLASWTHPSGLMKPHNLPCRSCQMEGSLDGYDQGLQMPLTPPFSPVLNSQSLTDTAAGAGISHTLLHLFGRARAQPSVSFTSLSTLPAMERPPTSSVTLGSGCWLLSATNGSPRLAVIPAKPRYLVCAFGWGGRW